MPTLPRLTARQIIAVLEKAGFTVARQSGGHIMFKNTSGRIVTVPFQSAKTLHPYLLKSLLLQADLSVEDIEKLL